MRKIILLALNLACGAAQNALAEGWACTIDKAAGFERDGMTDKWVMRTFKPSSKYVIKKTEKSDLDREPDPFVSTLPHEWAVHDNLGPLPVAYCGVNEVMKQFVCSAPLGDYELLGGPSFLISFDPKSLRFMAIFAGGYANANLAPTSMIQIGSCFPI
jgi:hypothetical protein